MSYPYPDLTYQGQALGTGFHKRSRIQQYPYPTSYTKARY